jgi:hypothetical protein
VHPFESATPPFLILSGPSDRMVPQQSLPGRIPMEVKGYDAVGHVNMVPGEPIARDDTLSIESGQRWIGQIDTSKDVASAMAKEYAVWEQPPTLRISFGSGFELIHTKTIPDTTRKRSSLFPQSGRSLGTKPLDILVGTNTARFVPVLRGDHSRPTDLGTSLGEFLGALPEGGPPSGREGRQSGQGANWGGAVWLVRPNPE